MTTLAIAKKIAVFAISIAEFCDRNRPAILSRSRMFKDALRLYFLINLDAKGAKRSVKMLAIKFYMSFFKKYFVVHELLAVKFSFSKIHMHVLKGFILVVSTVYTP